MSVSLPADTCTRTADRPPVRERPFWSAVGAGWRQLAGGFAAVGFSLEWHDWHALTDVDWSGSFHPDSVEICLNLEGSAWVSAQQNKMEFGPETTGFFAVQGRGLGGTRLGGQRHRFLSAEFSLRYLRDRLSGSLEELHGVLRATLDARPNGPPLSGVAPLNHRQRDLLRSLLRPPVVASAQRLWYESKALELAAEFFYANEEGGTSCPRPARVAAERVARVKDLLWQNLATTPTLEEIGRRVGCSPFHLSRTFSRETGMTISQWLRRARLERAAELLRSGTVNVTEAAMEVGYSSLSHFSQAFHEMFGCCPGLYPLRTPTQRPVMRSVR